jgi:hypothetical protein
MTTKRGAKRASTETKPADFTPTEVQGEIEPEQASRDRGERSGSPSSYFFWPSKLSPSIECGECDVPKFIFSSAMRQTRRNDSTQPRPHAFFLQQFVRSGDPEQDKQYSSRSIDTETSFLAPEYEP